MIVILFNGIMPNFVTDNYIVEIEKLQEKLGKALGLEMAAQKAVEEMSYRESKLKRANINQDSNRRFKI
jgi:ABC-type Fe3+-hydroxamate transport system substrate-binding protein